MAAHGKLDRVGYPLARTKRGFRPLMAVGDPIGHRDGAKFARRAACRSNALLHRLCLPHQSDVAGGGLVPAGGNADQGLVNLLACEPHRVKIRTVRRPRCAFRHVSAGKPGFIENAIFHGTWFRICRPNRLIVRMQAPSHKLDAARGSGRRFLSRHARATDAEQMRFCLKIHNSKLLKTKKAVSSYYAKSMLTCRPL